MDVIDNIEFKLIRSASCDFSAEALVIKPDHTGAWEKIPQAPAEPMKIRIGTVDGEEQEMYTRVDPLTNHKAKWHFKYEATAPQSVTVTIEPD